MPELLDVHAGDVVHCDICFSLVNMNSYYVCLIDEAATLLES